MASFEVKLFLQELRKLRLSKQQIKTLRGQVFAGDLAGARKGLERLSVKNQFLQKLF